MNSFKLRIAIFNTLVTSILLVVMAVVSLFMLHRLQVQELEHDLQEFASRGIPRFHHLHAYQTFGNEMDATGQEGGRAGLPWLLLGKNQVVLYKSQGWPETIEASGIPTDQIKEDLLGFPPSRTGPTNIDFPAMGLNRPFGGRPPEHMAPGEPGRPPPQPAPVLKSEPLRLLELRVLGSQLTGQILGIFQNDMLTLAVVGELSPVYKLLKSSASAFLMSMPVVILLLIFTSYWLSQRAIRPVLELTESTAAIDSRSLHERVDLKNADREFARLGSVFNEMLERLEKSFYQAKRFSSDAAHELKTPLAILQGELEVAIQESVDGSEQQQRLGSLAAEVQQLRQITTKLLYLSQADSGKLELSKEFVNFSEMIEEMALDIELIAPHISISTEIEKDISLDADPVLLGQIVHNLTSNAIKYNRDGGGVNIRLSQECNSVCLRISNTGPCIPVDAETRVFERFFRVISSHSANVEGYGLGLSLAYEFAKAHNGDLILEENEDDKICFLLTL